MDIIARDYVLACGWLYVSEDDHHKTIDFGVISALVMHKYILTMGNSGNKKYIIKLPSDYYLVVEI